MCTCAYCTLPIVETAPHFFLGEYYHGGCLVVLQDELAVREYNFPEVADAWTDEEVVSEGQSYWDCVT
jgi:hypothetical protein